MTILEEIIEQVRQHPKLVVAEDYEIVASRRQTKERTYENGIVKEEAAQEYLRVGLRVLHRKQPGRASVSTGTRGDLNELVSMAFNSSQRASADPWFRFPIWKRWNPQAPELPSEEEAYHSLFDHLEGSGNLKERLTESTYSVMIFRKTEKSPRAETRRIRKVLLSYDDRPRGGGCLEEEKVVQGSPVALGKWVKRLDRLGGDLRGAVTTAPSGRFRVILSPSVMAKLLPQFGHWFCADRLQPQQNPWHKQLGKRVAARCLNLQDNALTTAASHCTSFDMEGVLTQETHLIVGGTLQNFLHDAQTAARQNRASTGNYHRFSNEAFPCIQPSNLYVSPTEKSLEDLFNEMGSGFYFPVIQSIDRVEGSHFLRRVILRGFEMPSHGDARPLGLVQATWDLPEILRAAVAIGNDLAFFGHAGSPSILFEGIPLG